MSGKPAPKKVRRKQMGLKKVEGHTTLMRGTAVTETQFKLVQDIMKWNKGDGKIRRKDLKLAHGELRGKKASPYFIAKNESIQVKGEHGVYDLGRFKLAAVKKAASGGGEEMPATKKKTAKKKAAPPKGTAKKRKEIAAPAAAEEAVPAVA